MKDSWRDPEHPPWGVNFNAGNGVWFAWVDGKVHVWHWCDRNVTIANDKRDGIETGTEIGQRDPAWYEPQWVLVGVGAHTQLAGPPVTLVPTELTLEPSILWPLCCNKHGYLRQGEWKDC